MTEQEPEKAATTGSTGAPTGVRLSDGPVRTFMAGVRAALADLPAAEADDILDDVRSHIDELTGELGPDADEEAVVARLGSPESYAAELRAAAGYPPVPEPEPSTPDPAERRAAVAARLAVLGLVGADGFRGPCRWPFPGRRHGPTGTVVGS